MTDIPPLEAECRHFLACVARRDEPVADGAHGLAVLRVLEAASRSAVDGGSPVPVVPSTGQESLPGAYDHPTATIDDGPQIGAGTQVWHYCHVAAGAVIGQRFSLGQSVFVAGGARNGDDVRIQNNVSVSSGVVLEDGVLSGPSAVFTKVTRPSAEVNRKSEYATTVVRRGATLGANATILCGLTVGAYAFVGAGAIVTADVAPHALGVGAPARPAGWMCACGERLPSSGRSACDRCVTTYEISEGGVRAIE